MKIVKMPGPENISIEWNGKIYLLYGSYEHGCLTVMPEHIVREDRSEMSEKEKVVFMQEAYSELHFDPPYRLDFDVPFNWKGELLYSEENGTIKYPDIKCTCKLLESISEFSDKNDFRMMNDMIIRAENYKKFKKNFFPSLIGGRKANVYICEKCRKKWYVVQPDEGGFCGSIICR